MKKLQTRLRSAAGQLSFVGAHSWGGADGEEFTLARSVIRKPKERLSVLTGPRAARGAVCRGPGHGRVGTSEQAPPWASAWPTAPSGWDVLSWCGVDFHTRMPGAVRRIRALGLLMGPVFWREQSSYPPGRARMAKQPARKGPGPAPRPLPGNPPTWLPCDRAGAASLSRAGRLSFLFQEPARSP